jgi:hypothetical protein
MKYSSREKVRDLVVAWVEKGVLMALVHIAGKLKFGAERKRKKRKKAYLNNWTPWN